MFTEFGMKKKSSISKKTNSKLPRMHEDQYEEVNANKVEVAVGSTLSKGIIQVSDLSSHKTSDISKREKKFSNKPLVKVKQENNAVEARNSATKNKEKKSSKEEDDFMEQMQEDLGLDDDFMNDLLSDDEDEEENKEDSEESDSEEQMPEPPIPQKITKDVQFTSELTPHVHKALIPHSNLISTKTLTSASLNRVSSASDTNHSKIYDPSREIAELQHKLHLQSSEVERLTLAKQYSSIKTTSNFHLAFLFASPLVRKVNQTLETIMQLDYTQEISGIVRTLRDVKHEIIYKTQVATLDNFKSVVLDTPFALHFTGHGIENNKQSLGSAYRTYRDRGNILLLEDQNSMADYLFANDLKKLVANSKADQAFNFNYEVVFVSSCHSEFAGRIFLESGAHHVICILKSETISDKASLRFSKVFYQTLFVKKYSVWVAFRVAKDDVRTVFNACEANKYMLLVNKKYQEPGKNKKLQHKCFAIAKFNEGGLKKDCIPPIFDNVPSRVEKFKGRQHEIWEVLKHLNESRLVNILGPPGIGKTALSRHLCHHLRDRNRFTDGIIYVTLRGCESSQMFLTRLSLAIQDSVVEGNDTLDALLKNTSLNESEDQMSKKNQREYERSIFVSIINVLRDREFLMLLDNCEDLLEEDGNEFVKQLDDLLTELPEMKMLLTSRKYVNKLENHAETPIHLYSLSSYTSVKLLLDNVTRKIENSEIEELLAYEIPDDHPIHENFPVMDLENKTLTHHPFMSLLGGHPQAIALAAPMLEHQTLTQLFQQLLDSNVMDALDYQEKQSYSSLRMSLDISINNMKKTLPEALDLFSLIGLLPGGIKQEELNELWGNKSWSGLKHQLIRASILVYKPTEDILMLLPFMSTRALELLEKDTEKQTEYHLKWCKFFKDYCKAFLESINSNDFDLLEFVQKESNIWACIYRGINRKRQNDEYDEEIEVSWNQVKRSVTTNFQKDKKRIDLFDKWGSPLRKNNRNDVIEEAFDESHDSDSQRSDSVSNIGDFAHRISIFKQNIDIRDESEPNNSGSIEAGQVDVNFLRESMVNSAELRSKTHALAKVPIRRRSMQEVDTAYCEKYKDEEMLVLYYISIVIRLCKLSDARKAINEYSKKPMLSDRTLAHLNQFKGVLALMSQDKNWEEIESHFNQAKVKYDKCNSILGRAIWDLALLREKWDQDLNMSINGNESKELNAKLDQVENEFSKIGHDFGIQRAQNYKNFLMNKLNKQDSTDFKKLVRFKTFKKSYISDLATKDADLGHTMMHDENIKLFTTVIEIDPKVLENYSEESPVLPFFKKNLGAMDSASRPRTQRLSLKQPPLGIHKLSQPKPPLATQNTLTFPLSKKVKKYLRKNKQTLSICISSDDLEMGSPSERFNQTQDTTAFGYKSTERDLINENNQLEESKTLQVTTKRLKQQNSASSPNLLSSEVDI